MNKICFILICIFIGVSTKTDEIALNSITNPCSICQKSSLDNTGPVIFPVQEETSQGCGEKIKGCGETSQGCGENSQGCVENIKGCGETTQSCGENSKGCGENSQGFGENSKVCGEDIKGCGETSQGCGENIKGCGSNENEETNESDCEIEANYDKEAIKEVILESIKEKLKDKIESAKEKVKDKLELIKVKLKEKLAILTAGASVTASILVIQVAVLPLLFKYSKCVQRKMVFSNCINYPRNLNYESPSSVDIVGGRNFSIQFESETDKCPIKIGIWHIVPKSLFCNICKYKEGTDLDSEILRELKSTTNTIVLYCHGNSNHRASPHRLQMYKVFQELNFHVITFDYRGYGDSSQVRPTEQGVVEDCLYVYNWLIKSLDPSSRPTILLWGHSLGSAVAANLVAHLPSLCKQHSLELLPAPDALVLESPFNNLSEEIASHPFSKLVSWLPYYHQTFVIPFLESPEFTFTTDQYLTQAPDQPALMLHCRGDKIVPYELAVKLYETVNKSRGPGSAPLVLHSFEKGHGLGHNNICEAHNLKKIVRNFLDMLNLEKPDSDKLLQISTR